MAKAFKRGLKWVPMIEGARMVVRLNQAPKRFQTNQEVIFALIEAARTGRVTARGTCFATQKPKKIPPRDWQECPADWGRFALYEPGRRLPRFTHIEFEAAGIEQEFGPATREPARPRPHHHSSPALDRAKRALDDIYPHGVPDQATESNKSLCQKGAAWLKQKKLDSVSDRTILRAAGRSK
jgi:hypothetical protein